MLTDERTEIRELALRKIIEAREAEAANPGFIRSFSLPKINFQATDYKDMIDWSSTEVTSPPVLKNFSDEQLRNFLPGNKIPQIWDFQAFPAHTQAVERIVKLVTEASSKVFGQEVRDGHIRATLASRALMPQFETKRDFSH